MTSSDASSKPSASERTNPARLLPERLSWLLGERPTLPFESEDDYDGLLAELIAAYDPKETVEFIHVKELADHQWELLRLRHMRRAAMETELTRAAHNLLADDYREATGEYGIDAQRGLTYMVRAAAAGDASQSTSLLNIASEAGVTQRMLRYEAYRLGMRTMTALDEAISTSERRRDYLIRMIEDRRRTMNTMSKSLLADKSADVVTDSIQQNAA